MNISAMLNHPRLTNAPIAEAVIEIRVRMFRPVVSDCFAAFKDRLKGRFPKSQDIRFLASHLQIDGENQVKNDVSNTLFGVRLDDPEGKWVVQAKADGLAVSRLAPYETWESLIKAVRDIWPVYVEVFDPQAVLRLGVRYINRVPLPDVDGFAGVDLDTVLTAGPKIPPTLPQSFSQYVTRLVVPMHADGIVLTLVQAMDPTAQDSAVAAGHVVLDIDAACEQSFDVDSPEMWRKLDALRVVKNSAFFGSLTEQTWRQFV